MNAGFRPLVESHSSWGKFFLPTFVPESRVPMQTASRGPSFAFVGTIRGGSTWFFEILREHPGVFVPPNKGTYFFSQWHYKGKNWYEAFFPDRARQMAVGEVCEDYLANPHALARMKAYDPSIRLVCCLRNPYERALSEWGFWGRNGLARPTLSEQSEFSPGLFRTGYYATQLQTVFSLFPANQVLVFLFDDLKTAANQIARRLYTFIGADPNFEPRSLWSVANANGKPRLRVLARLVHDVHMHSWGRSRAASNVVGTLKRIRPLRGMVRTLLYKEQPLYEDWMNYLAEFPQQVIVRYEQEIGALESILGKDLSHWRAPGHPVDV